jgi:hypothetical protein
VAHWEGDRHGAKEVIIDPEFGAFGDNGCIDFIKTDFDRDLDKDSLLPGVCATSLYLLFASEECLSLISGHRQKL